MRRKRIRQTRAALRERERLLLESTAEYKLQQSELERCQREEMRLRDEENEKWIQREVLARENWKNRQEKIAKVQFEKRQQTLRIKMEWEEQKRKIEKIKEEMKKQEEERLKRHRDLMQRLEEFISHDGDLPIEFMKDSENNPDKEACPFFSKTGTCRFDNACSRNHRKPAVSKVLLIRNMFTHYGLEHWTPDECDADRMLEFDHEEVHRDFVQFYNDVLPEFQQYGTVRELKVCSNFAKHLRGNTYIEYKHLREAVKAFRVFHGRWFGGKQISLEFCKIPSWRQAICGLFYNDKCPKGQACNFLHVFQNPQNCNVKKQERRRRSEAEDKGKYSTSGHWRWSESPERK